MEETYMQIEIVSDIHLPFDRDLGVDYLTSLVPEEETRILVVAGYMGDSYWWRRAKQYLDIICTSYPHVLYVAGNHDYHGTTLSEGDERFRELDNLIENFHFIEREVIELEGKRFAGCSLWFKEDPKSYRYEMYLNDFREIRDFKPEVYERNEESVEFLRRVENVDVVITHHMPSLTCVAPRYENHPCNRYFLCEMDDVIAEKKPKVWVFGHTHVPSDFTLYATRMIANPRGYPGENNFGERGYRPVIVEV